jgi:hypothetical protein
VAGGASADGAAGAGVGIGVRAWVGKSTAAATGPSSGNASTGKVLTVTESVGLSTDVSAVPGTGSSAGATPSDSADAASVTGAPPNLSARATRLKKFRFGSAIRAKAGGPTSAMLGSTGAA